MKKIMTLTALTMAASAIVNAQSIPGAASIARNDINGTARFISMGGAFGALGGDLSVLGQNPGGIGVYRNSDVGFTVDLTFNEGIANRAGNEWTTSNTRFNLDNIGGVFALKLPSYNCPNLNFGFTVNKIASFNRRINGEIPDLHTSLSNYIAAISQANGLTEADVQTTDKYNPYDNPNVPWLSILGYDGFLTNPETLKDGTHWTGQFGDGTTGIGDFSHYEKGSIYESNVAIGGNIQNKVYWGLDVGITTLDYRLQSVWGETLDNAYVYNPNSEKVGRYDCDWAVHDNYRMYGTGVNLKLGVIVKPIQELRLGLAFHTPTYYNMTEKYADTYVDFNYPFKTGYDEDYAEVNGGWPVSNSLNFQTPWRIIASAAGVLMNSFIISADYEWAAYNGMRYSAPTQYFDSYYNPWYDYDYGYGWGWFGAETRGKTSSQTSPYAIANSQIKQTYCNTSTVRVGAEFRITSNFSVRAGYSYMSSPIKTQVKEGLVSVPGTGLLPCYTLDNGTNYVSFGLGFKSRGFYADLAYQYRNQSADYFPFSPDTSNPASFTRAKLNFDSHKIALSLGYKF